jgi:hypothetical protein
MGANQIRIIAVPPCSPLVGGEPAQTERPPENGGLLLSSEYIFCVLVIFHPNVIENLLYQP